MTKNSIALAVYADFTLSLLDHFQNLICFIWDHNHKLKIIRLKILKDIWNLKYFRKEIYVLNMW